MKLNQFSTSNSLVTEGGKSQILSVKLSILLVTFKKVVSYLVVVPTDAFLVKKSTQFNVRDDV